MENSYFLGRLLPRFVFETTCWILRGLFSLWKDSEEGEVEKGIIVSDDEAVEIKFKFTTPPPPKNKNSKPYFCQPEKLTDSDILVENQSLGRTRIFFNNQNSLEELKRFPKNRTKNRDSANTDLKFRGPPPKRQKIFDIEEERAVATVQKFRELNVPSEKEFILRQLQRTCPYTTPSFVIRILEDFHIPVVGVDEGYIYSPQEVRDSFEKNSLPNLIPRPFAYSCPPRTAKESLRIYNDFLRKPTKMAATGDSQLFEETFRIIAVDQTKYDRVARIEGHSPDGSTTMTLDINTELWPITPGESVKMVLASSLALDGSKDDGRGWRDVGRGADPTLADMFEYVCHGKCYKFEDGPEGQTMKTYVSFGGLLLALNGPYKKLTPLRVDYVYLLLIHA